MATEATSSVLLFLAAHSANPGMLATQQWWGGGGRGGVKVKIYVI